MEEKKKNLLILISFVVVAVLAIGIVIVSFTGLLQFKKDFTKIVPLKNIEKVDFVIDKYGVLVEESEDEIGIWKHYVHTLDEDELKQFKSWVKNSKYKFRKKGELTLGTNRWVFDVWYTDGTRIRFGDLGLERKGQEHFEETGYIGVPSGQYILSGALKKFVSVGGKIEYPIDFNEETFFLQD